MRLVTARVLDAVRGAAIREHAEALEAEWGAGSAAERSVAARDGNAGVNIEAPRRASATRGEGAGE
jgi:hypothetical protein